MIVSPIEHPQTISGSVGVSFTPSDHQQLGDWSSRYDIPVPERVDTVELRQRVVTPIVHAAALVPYDHRVMMMWKLTISTTGMY